MITLGTVLGLKEQNKGKVVGREPGAGAKAGCSSGSEDVGSVWSKAYSCSTR